MPGRYLPQEYGSVFAPAGKNLSIRAESDRPYSISMTQKGIKATMAAYFP